jgi:hypothetical protein
MHPSWYMKPINVCMRLVGIDRIILGSTGHGGRAAAEQLVRDRRCEQFPGRDPRNRRRALEGRRIDKRRLVSALPSPSPGARR